jgi:tetratricopeptide (TPR) repeat protein
MKSAVRVFFDTGQVSGSDLAALARECDRSVRLMGQESLKAARVLARRFVRRAEPHAGVLIETAYRTLGWICHLSCDYRGSESAYLEARRLASRDALTRARIDRILIDVYMYLGNMPEARRRTRLALDTFKRLGAEEEAARTRVNFANVLHRQDRHKEALAQYTRASR